MKNDAVQHELFEEFEAPKRKKAAIRGILPKNYMLVNVTYEQLVSAAIAVIMLMVFLFSLGVERGKRMITAERIIQPQRQAEAKKEEPLKNAALDEQAGEAASEAKKTQVPLQPAVVKEIPAGEEKKTASGELYTIQLIAHKSKKSSQEEMTRLEKKGHKPFIIVGGGYFQVCVGEYKDANEAKKDLSEFKKGFKGCFVRKR